jgi:hypothetical protein
VMVGDPAKCIPFAAREHSVDLVLMSRARGRSHGAYSNELGGVLSRLRCPLLTIPVDAVQTVRPTTDAARVPAATSHKITLPAQEPISAATRPSSSSLPDLCV